MTLRFSSPVRAVKLTADGARRLAAKLLLLAETADAGDVGTFATPAGAIEPAPCIGDEGPRRARNGNRCGPQCWGCRRGIGGVHRGSKPEQPEPEPPAAA
ncbi:MAG TPA: hypothetical protein VF989_06700 [Polyangiaceae bacterium]